MGAAGANVDVLIEGEELAHSDFVSYVVDRDMFQPDMAVITLSNQNDIHSGKWAAGASVELKVGKDKTSIFKGELVGIEGIYKGGEPTKLVIRALNKMHRLLRAKKSKTYTDKTDQQILNEVAGNAGLSVEWKHTETITHKHVYQHNQSDLEFIRTRAARLGCHVWCVDTKLYIKEPDFDSAPVAELSIDEGGALRSFHPRMNSTGAVKKVTVKGWNPETKELIVGDASVTGSRLGSATSVSAASKLAADETFTVDHPIRSKQEAMALAKARLRDLNLTYITADVEMAGSPIPDLGKNIKITANATNEAAKDPFNGKYYIMGVTHRHTMPKGAADGGYVTILKVARDGEKQ